MRYPDVDDGAGLLALCKRHHVQVPLPALRQAFALHLGSAPIAIADSPARPTLSCRFVPFAHRATAGAMFGALWNMCAARCAPSAFPRNFLCIYLSHRANSDSSKMSGPAGNGA